jgi:serine/threonine protein kinase
MHKTLADIFAAHADMVLSTHLSEELLALQDAKASDFEYFGPVDIGCNCIVVRGVCTKPGFPHPSKIYAIRILQNLQVVPPDVLESITRSEIDHFVASWPCPQIVRLWAAFVDVLPRQLRELLPRSSYFHTVCTMHPVASVHTVFTVFDAHKTTLGGAGSLFSLFAAGMDEPPPLYLFRQHVKDLSLALLFLDAKHICHLDMKLNNVLEKSDGGLCVCDLGDARPTIGGQYTLPSVTVARDFGGNVAHLSPEVRLQRLQLQLRTKGQSTSHIDLSKQPTFELGVTLFELLFGCHPIPDYGKDDMELFGFPCGTGVVHPAKLRTLSHSGYPTTQLRNLLMDMTAFHPHERPTLAAAVASLFGLLNIREGFWTCECGMRSDLSVVNCPCCTIDRPPGVY